MTDPQTPDPLDYDQAKAAKLSEEANIADETASYENAIEASDETEATSD